MFSYTCTVFLFWFLAFWIYHAIFINYQYLNLLVPFWMKVSLQAVCIIEGITNLSCLVFNIFTDREIYIVVPSLIATMFDFFILVLMINVASFQILRVLTKTQQAMKDVGTKLHNRTTETYRRARRKLLIFQVVGNLVLILDFVYNPVRAADLIRDNARQPLYNEGE